MDASHFLLATHDLLDSVDAMLQSQAIRFVRLPNQCVGEGRKRTELGEIRCFDQRGEVVIAIEKRLSQTRASLMLIPSRRWLFWHNHDSARLAQHLAQLLIAHGATED